MDKSGSKKSFTESVGDLLGFRKKHARGASSDDLLRFADQMGYRVLNVDNDPKNWTVVPKSISDEDLNSIGSQMLNIDQNGFATAANRVQRFKSYARMDSSGGEGCVVLDTYADEILNVSNNTTESLKIEISDAKIAPLVKQVLDINGVLTSARQDVRSMCKWGDGAYLIQPRAGARLVLNPDDLKEGSRIDTPLDPDDIVLRYVNGDQYELSGVAAKIYRLTMKSQTGGGLYAKDMIRDGQQFQPWEFTLFSVKDRDSFPYGKSILESMRTAYEKLSVLELLLAVTRANKMDRIAIKIPNINTADPASALMSLSHIKNMLKTIVLSSGSSGLSDGRATRNQDVALTEYLFVPAQFEVSKLSTSLDFGSTEDVEYFRDKVITASRLPKGYFLADKTENRPGTLQQQDLKFARALIPLGEAYCDGLKRLITLTAFYLGADLSTLEVKVSLQKSPYISSDLLTTYDDIMNIVDKFSRIKKSIQGDDTTITSDSIKRLLDLMGASHDLLYPETSQSKAAKPVGSLMEALSL